MVSDLLPFQLAIDTATIAGVALWALALYLGFSPVTDWVTERLNRWLNFADQSLYFSKEAFDQDKEARESLNALNASLLSVIPFLVVGGLCNYGVEVGLGHSWAVSVGMIACMGGGVYELGRRDGQSSE